MTINSSDWLTGLFEKAGYTTQAECALAYLQFAHAEDKDFDERKISNMERKLRGWGSGDRKYRANVPFETLAEFLNKSLPEDSRVIPEKLQTAHQKTVKQRDAEEVRKNAKIDPQSIITALNKCNDSLREALLSDWGASGDLGLAAQKIIEAIKNGNALLINHTFNRSFRAAIRADNSRENREQIWGIVEAVSQACFIPGINYKTGEKQDVSTNLAWLMRISVLTAKNLPINGVHSDRGKELDDSKTDALIVDSCSTEENPLKRVYELVKDLVKKYDPGRKLPPNPESNMDAFDQYCYSLNASLGSDNDSEELFFLLMKSSESDDTLKHIYSLLPELMCFISAKVEGLVEGSFLTQVRDVYVLAQWIANWLKLTSHKFDFERPVPEKENKKSDTEEKEPQDMKKPNSRDININGENPTVIISQDKPTATTTVTNQKIEYSAEVEKVLTLLAGIQDTLQQEEKFPEKLNEKIVDIQQEIKQTQQVPGDYKARIKNAIVETLAAGNNISTIMNNINQLIQGLF